MDDNLHQVTLKAFAQLPRNKEAFFRELWAEKKLKFAGMEGQTDPIDLYCAQLVCTTLSQQQRLLIVLPDHAPRRMPLLFTTGLVMHAIDFLDVAKSHYIIYFGTSATIKNYLSQTYIRDQKLSDIFNQTQVGRHTIKTKGDFSSNLPRIVFSYAPTNAEQILEAHHPQWVFFDCGDGDKTEWVYPLFDKLAENNIACLVCVQNPLSNIVDLFQKRKWLTFAWPTKLSQTTKQTEITPFIINSASALQKAEKFQAVNHTLMNLSKQTKGRLERDARQAVHHYVRALEDLIVPLQFFEAESKHYWGVHPLQILKQTATRFVEAIATRAIQQDLQKILVTITPVHEHFITHKPPFWVALEQLCIDPPRPEIPTILIFQNRASRQLFSLAMLAENNITEPDLQTLNVWLMTLKQFVQWQLSLQKMKRDGLDVEEIPQPLKDNYPIWHPILIGPPKIYNYTRYAHLFSHQQMGVLLLPHQVHLANWHFEQWNRRFDEQVSQNMMTLSQLASHPPNTSQTSNKPTTSKRLLITAANDILLDDKVETIRSRIETLFKVAPRTEELAYLMDEIPAQVEVSPVADENPADVGDVSPQTFIDKALFVRFREKYEVAFSIEDKIQLIIETPTGRSRQERSVRSLRAGDAVLFINGQHRYNLYDLIISRVHDHPTFAVHISLIERWQDELVTCFQKAQKPLSQILSQMQARGSQLQTESAIRFWLWGKVMCPKDAQDLQRIAEILEMPFVKQYHRQINRAARRLRGIHRSLARRLNTWLEQEALTSQRQSFNDVIDEDLGLEFKDFREALLILTVESMTEEEGLFLISDLRQLKIIH